MARTINDIAKANQYIDKSNVRTVITFRTQQLYDLWVNEMSGQISDGMWENSNRTEWIWRNVYVQLGDVTKVEVTSTWDIRRKSFGMTKELWDVVGDRILDENGFATEKEARAAWREIAQAIHNAAIGPEAQRISEGLRAEKRNNAKSQRQGILDEWKQVEGLKCSDWDSSYVYASLDFNQREIANRDGSVRKAHSWLFLHIEEDREGNLKHRIEWNSVKWYAKPGKLLETLKAIKEFDAKLLELQGTPVNTLF